MADAHSPSGERQPRRRRWWRRCALGGLVLAALLGAGYLLRARWLAPLAIRWVRAEARERLGAELEIAHLGGGWWGDLTLEGVRWRSSQGPLLRLDEGRIELEYSLRGALSGRPALRVRAQGRGLELDLAREPGAEPGGELPELPRVELEFEDLLLRGLGPRALALDTLRAQGSLDARELRLESLSVAAGENRLALRSVRVSLADVSTLELARSFRGELQASLPRAEELGATLGTDWPLRAAELTLTASEGCATLAGSAELRGGRLEVRRGELLWPRAAAWRDIQLDLELGADFADLAPLGALAGQELGGRWQGSIDVSGPLRAPMGFARGRGQDLRLGELVVDTADIEVRTDGLSARFERCTASGPDFEAVLRGELRFEPLELVDVALGLSAGPAALARLVPVPCEQLFVYARLAGPPAALTGSFEASVSGVDLGALRIDDSQVRGTLAGDVLRLEELRLMSGESFVELAGELTRAGTGFTAEIERLALAWRGAQVGLERGAHLVYAPGRVELEGIELRSHGAGGAEGRATIALRHTDGETRGALAFDDYDAGPLLAPFLPPGWSAGRIDGSLAGELGGAAPAATLDLALDGWSLGPEWAGFAARLRGTLSGRELALERIELSHARDESARLSGWLRAPFVLAQPLDLRGGPVQLALGLETGDLARTLAQLGFEPPIGSTGPCRLEVELGGAWEGLAGSVRVAAERVTLGTEPGARACDLAAELHVGERLEIARALFSAPSGSIVLSGAIETPFDPRAWADRWVLLDAPLDLTAEVALGDIGWVAAASRDLRRISGSIQGRIGVRGTALEPELDGTLEWSGGELRLASDAAPLRNLSALLRFEGDVVHVERLEGEIGGAPVRVQGTLEPFGPFRRMDLRVRGERLLLARDAKLRVRADAALLVKGTPSALSIRGDLELTEGLYLGEISPLEELFRAGRRVRAADSGGPERLVLFPHGPLANAEFDVHLGGTAFEYRTNLLRARLRPDLDLRGTGAFPVLEGPVYLESAAFTLPSGKLELTSGVLNFRREQLGPDAALTAEMSVQNHDVRATATGSLDELEIVLSSSPPLPSDDLWVLVLTGQLPAGRWQDRSTQAMESLALFLARDTLVRWFSDEPGDGESLLERFEIDVGAKTSHTGQPTGRVLFYLKPKSRSTGRATYLSAELDEYDRVNYALGIVFRPR